MFHKLIEITRVDEDRNEMTLVHIINKGGGGDYVKMLVN